MGTETLNPPDALVVRFSISSSSGSSKKDVDSNWSVYCPVCIRQVHYSPDQVERLKGSYLAWDKRDFDSATHLDR